MGTAAFSAILVETFSLGDFAAELLTNSRPATPKLFSNAVAGVMGSSGFGLGVSICAFALSGIFVTFSAATFEAALSDVAASFLLVWTGCVAALVTVLVTRALVSRADSFLVMACGIGVVSLSFVRGTELSLAGVTLTGSAGFSFSSLIIFGVSTCD
jgi:hypothetical protein